MDFGTTRILNDDSELTFKAVVVGLERDDGALVFRLDAEHIVLHLRLELHLRPCANLAASLRMGDVVKTGIRQHAVHDGAVHLQPGTGDERNTD